MSNLISIPFVPGTGLNYDDDPRFMQPGDGYRKNVVPVNDGKDGLLSTIKGHIVKALTDTITGTTKSVVGATYDVKTRSIIFFLKSRTGGTIYDSIVRYNIGTDNYTTIVKENLNLNFGSRVEARVIDDYLIWTSPKIHSISISEAIAYTAGTASEYEGDGFRLTEEELSFIRYAPASPPGVAYKSDETYIYNHLRGRQFQFCYKYEYFDYSHSVWSPISEVPLGEADEDIYGNFVEDDEINNIIDVTIPDGSEIVRKIHLAAREGNSSLFRLVKVIDKDLETYSEDVTYEFKNDTRGDVIPDEEIFRLYDDVPREADFVEVIDKNVVCFGQVLKGYDPPDPDVTLTLSSKAVTITPYVDVGAVTKVYDSENEWIRWLLPDVDYNGVEVEVGFVGNEDMLPNYLVSKNTFGDGATRASVLTYFTNTISIPFDTLNVSGTDWLRFPSQDTQGDAMLYRGEDAAYVKLTSVAADESTEKFSSFKFGEQHSFALGYKDEQGRLMYLLRSDDMDVDISFLRAGLGARNEINWTISHAAPTGAKYYQWFYAKNTPTFLQVPLLTNPLVEEISLRSGGYFLNINKAVDRYRAEGIELPYYTFTKGDRLRIIGGGDLDDLDPETALYDIEIKAEETVDEDTYIVIPDGSYTFPVDGYVFIEIYTPRKTTPAVFREFSDVYEIAGGVHQDLTGAFTNGDVYARLVAPWFWGESQSYSYYYESDSISVGKPVFYNPNQRAIELSDVVHGGRYFEDTQINELFTFRTNPAATFSKRFGDIKGMILRGDTLRVYQEKKNHSVYIGASLIRRPDGSDDLVASDRILGTVVTGRNDWGTQHPDSVIKVGRNIYFYDGYNHTFLRDSVNGVFPISGKVQMGDYAFDYKMRTYFKEDFTTVKCGYDPYNELLFVRTDDDVLAFHEDTNRWVGFYDFLPELMFGAEKTFLSWKNGLTYVHNPSEEDESDNYKYYGTAYDTIIKFYPSFPVKKFFKAITLHSNKELDLEVDIPSDNSYIRGMHSWIDSDWFVLKRGIYYSAFLRNANTTSSTDSTTDLYSGEKLRGYFAEIELKGKMVEIFKVDILIQ